MPRTNPADRALTALRRTLGTRTSQYAEPHDTRVKVLDQLAELDQLLTAGGPFPSDWRKGAVLPASAGREPELVLRRLERRLSSTGEAQDVVADAIVAFAELDQLLSSGAGPFPPRWRKGAAAAAARTAKAGVVTPGTSKTKSGGAPARTRTTEVLTRSMLG